MEDDMRILVIGGAGYIGSHVNRLLLDEGHTTCVFDNFSSGRRGNLFPESGFIHGDIMQPESLRGAMRDGWDALIHLAAFKAAGESMDNPGKYALNNISGTVNILNAAVEHGVNFFVFSSSAAIFGEPQYLPIDEEHPKNPENFYGYTKLEIESLLQWYDKLKGIRFAALRYFNAAGYDPNGIVSGLEQNPANLLPVIMEAACGKRKELLIFGDDYETDDGTGVRDYVHVTDLADAHLRALNYITDKKESLTVNLGSEIGISVLEMLNTAREVSGREIPSVTVDRRAGDPAKLVATSKKALQVLGWKAKYSDVKSLVETSWKVYKDKML
jgi:UDP-glucose 4-epimerase